jgi:hypothetical protein
MQNPKIGIQSQALKERKEVQERKNGRKDWGKEGRKKRREIYGSIFIYVHKHFLSVRPNLGDLEDG